MVSFLVKVFQRKVQGASAPFLFFMRVQRSNGVRTPPNKHKEEFNMLNFQLGSHNEATHAIIVDKFYRIVASAPIAPWADKMDVADVLISYVRDNDIYVIPQRSSRT